MTYSGRYNVKNKKKYKGDPTQIVYRSMWEKYCFMWCDQNPKVKNWSSEEVVVPYYYDIDKRYHRYFVDLKIVMEDKTLLVEIKPEKETKPPVSNKKTKRYLSESLTYVKNMNKWKAASDYCKDRGWEFQIWTEQTLYSMGIMTKPLPGKLKKLKPLAPFKRKRKK